MLENEKWVIPGSLVKGQAVGIYDANMRDIALTGEVESLQLKDGIVNISIKIDGVEGKNVIRPLNEIRVKK